VSYVIEAGLFQFIAFAFATITTTGGLLVLARAFDDPPGRAVQGSSRPIPRLSTASR
jgi:hypothetical protein